MASLDSLQPVTSHEYRPNVPPLHYATHGLSHVFANIKDFLNTDQVFPSNFQYQSYILGKKLAQMLCIGQTTNGQIVLYRPSYKWTTSIKI